MYWRSRTSIRSVTIYKYLSNNHEFFRKYFQKNSCKYIGSTQESMRVTSTLIRSTLDVRKFASSQRTIHEWNRLPGECFNATSVNMFKNKIDKYFIKDLATFGYRSSWVSKIVVTWGGNSVKFS